MQMKGRRSRRREVDTGWKEAGESRGKRGAGKGWREGEGRREGVGRFKKKGGRDIRGEWREGRDG